MSFRRSFLVALLILWIVGGLFWSGPVAPTRAWLCGIAQAALVGALAAAAVRSGRRWSAPPLALGAALLGYVGPAMVGVLTGDFLARGLGPGYVLGFLMAWFVMSVLAAALGTGIALYRRRSLDTRSARAT